MNEYMVPSLCGRTYIYGNHADASVSSRVVAALTVHLDVDFLIAALEESRARFPHLFVSLKEVEGRYIFVPSDAEVPVFESTDDLPKDFSDPRLNGYLFQFSCSGKMIFMDFHRSLSDEFGMLSFMKAVLFRMLELSGYPVKNDGSVISLKSECLDSESTDPILRIDDLPASRPVWYMDAKAANFTVPESAVEETVQIRIPISKLKKEYAELPTIPITYMAPFMSHVIHQMNKENMTSGDYVVASVQVNLRPYFPASTMRPYHTSVFLAYNRNLNDYPYGTVLVSQKKLLEAQLKPDTLAYSAQCKIADFDNAYDNHTIEKINECFSEVQSKIASKSTYDICRIGNIMLPDSMQRLMNEFYVVIPASRRLISITVAVFKNELCVTASGRGSTRDFASALVDLLSRNNIESYISDKYLFEPIV